MSPAALKRALDPAYIGSPFAQPFQFFDGDVSTPMDLTGRAVVLFLDRQGLPDAHHEITGVIQADGRVLFSAADTSAWIKGDYSLEVRLDGASVVVGRIGVAKGAGANGSDMVGAAQPPTAPGVVIAGSGVVQVVSVAPSAATDPSGIILPPDLSAALGGAETLADALLWLAQNGGGPSPILRDLIGSVVISSVANGALSVAAAGQVLLSGAISSVSSATGSLTVGSASSIALVGAAVSTSSLTGAMTVVTQIALAGTASGSSAAAGSLTVEDGGVAPMSFPAQGAGYDFDWTHKLDPVSPYRVLAPHTGSQPIGGNTIPIIYKQMLSNAQVFLENEDGSLKYYAATCPQQTDRGLFSQSGLQNHMLRGRELNNALWVKTNVTVSRTQVGRDGAANTACRVTFTADDGTIRQAVTLSARNVRAALDAKRAAGTDPLEASTDDGVTWEAFPVLGVGESWGGWHKLVGAINNRTNPTLLLRSKAGNAFDIDFAHVVSKYAPDAGPLPADIWPYARFGDVTGGVRYKDRIHHTTVNVGGGPSGEDGINILRSQPSHGMFTHFGFRTDGFVVATVGGITVTTAASTQSIGVSGSGQLSALVDDQGDGSVMNKLFYFLHNGEMRVALNGALYRYASGALTTATTHDFATNGSGSPLGSYVRRQIWFDGSRVPTDAEMIAWTTL